MSISSIAHRPVVAPQVQSPVASAPSVASTPAQSPGNDLRRQLMSDSFDMGGAGGIGQALEQVSQAIEQISQMLQGLQGGGQVSDLGDAPRDLGASPISGAGGASPASGAGAAPSLQSAAPAKGAAKSESFGPGSDAGPGFGAPSAGANDPVNPAEPWLAKNNVGSPYNSNMLLIDPSQKGDYKYTNTFTNKTNEPQTITLWNKTGENGMPNDGQNFDKSTPKTFTLQPGESQLVAFDTNTSVAWCASKDGTAKPGANSGQTWGEATFANGTTGWSGYDTSQISPAGHNGKMSISNEANGHTVTEANAWQTPQDDPAGLDVGVPAGPLNLVTTFG